MKQEGFGFFCQPWTETYKNFPFSPQLQPSSKLLKLSSSFFLSWSRPPNNHKHKFLLSLFQSRSCQLKPSLTSFSPLFYKQTANRRRKQIQSSHLSSFFVPFITPRRLALFSPFLTLAEPTPLTSFCMAFIAILEGPSRLPTRIASGLGVLSSTAK